MVTKVCQECQQEFERPHHYPGKMMFCSIACSNRQNSRYRQQHFKFGDVHLASGFELRFLACLLRHGIDWSPWPDDDPFVYEGHEYRPDFRVGDLAVEVKGYEDENHPQRRARGLWDRDEALVEVRKSDLVALERCFSRAEFLDTLECMERPITKQAEQTDYVEAYLDGLVPGEYLQEEMEPHIVDQEE